MLSLSRDGIRESCHKHDSPLSVTTPASTSSFLVRALLPSPAVIAAIAAFVATLSRPDNADTLWHLAIGRWISIQRALPDIGSFYYSTVAGSGHNYSWLSQVILSGAYRFLGGAGVAILTSVIAGSIFYFLHKLLEQHGTGRSETGNQSNMLVNFTVLGLALTTIAVYLTGRPMMFTVAFFTLELVILSDFVHSRSKLIWLIPPMTALWANLHPGFVIAPLVILAFVPLVRETRDR